MTPIIDTAHARLVVSRANRAFKHREGLLSETDDLVENQIPDGVEPLSRDHALFLFYTAVNDHGMKSSRLYAKAKMLFLDRHDLFEPTKVVAGFIGPQDPKLVDGTGKQLGTRYPKETAKTWYINSERLTQRYGGDPRNLFRSSSDARELLKEIKTFRGYGPKIGGMILRAVVGLGFAEVSGIEEVLVPVDIHDSRICFLTGVLKLNDGTEGRVDYYAYVPKVQRVLLNACNSLGIKWLAVDRALWLIGSRGCVNRRCRLCPLHDICSIGREIVFNEPQRSLL
jgi:endonuclease III